MASEHVVFVFPPKADDEIKPTCRDLYARRQPENEELVNFVYEITTRNDDIHDVLTRAISIENHIFDFSTILMFKQEYGADNVVNCTFSQMQSDPGRERLRKEREFSFAVGSYPLPSLDLRNTECMINATFPENEDPSMYNCTPIFGQMTVWQNNETLNDMDTPSFDETRIKLLRNMKTAMKEADYYDDYLVADVNFMGIRNIDNEITKPTLYWNSTGFKAKIFNTIRNIREQKYISGFGAFLISFTVILVVSVFASQWSRRHRLKHMEMEMEMDMEENDEEADKKCEDVAEDIDDDMTVPPTPESKGVVSRPSHDVQDQQGMIIPSSVEEERLDFSMIQVQHHCDDGFDEIEISVAKNQT